MQRKACSIAGREDVFTDVARDTVVSAAAAAEQGRRWQLPGKSPSESTDAGAGGVGGAVGHRLGGAVGQRLSDHPVGRGHQQTSHGTALMVAWKRVGGAGTHLLHSGEVKRERDLGLDERPVGLAAHRPNCTTQRNLVSPCLEIYPTLQGEVGLAGCRCGARTGRSGHTFPGYGGSPDRSCRSTSKPEPQDPPGTAPASTLGALIMLAPPPLQPEASSPCFEPLLPERRECRSVSPLCWQSQD